MHRDELVNLFNEEILDKPLYDKEYHLHHPQPKVNFDPELARITTQLAAVDLSKERIVLQEETAGNLIGNLEEVIERVCVAEQLAEQFLETNYTNEWYLSKTLELITTTELLGDFLFSRQKVLADDLVTGREKLLQQGKQKTATCPPLREHLDQIADEYALISGTAKQRKIALEPKIEKSFSQYAEHRRIITLCRKKNDILLNEYQNIFTVNDSASSNPSALFKNIKEKLKKSSVEGRPLLKQCSAQDYFEGTVLLESLADELKIIRKDFSWIRENKKSLQRRVAYFEQIAGVVSNLSAREQYGERELQVLMELEQNVSQNIALSGLIFLEKEEQSYQHLQQNVRRAVSLIKAEEVSKSWANYRSLAVAEQFPESLAGIETALEVNQERKCLTLKLRQRFSILNLADGEEKINMLLTQLESRQRQYAEIKNTAEHLHSVKKELAVFEKELDGYGISEQRIVALHNLQKIIHIYPVRKLTRELSKETQRSFDNLSYKYVQKIDELWQGKDEADWQQAKKLYLAMGSVKDVSSRLEELNYLVETRKKKENYTVLESKLEELTGKYSQHIEGLEKEKTRTAEQLDRSRQEANNLSQELSQKTAVIEECKKGKHPLIFELEDFNIFDYLERKNHQPSNEVFKKMQGVLSRENSVDWKKRLGQLQACLQPADFYSSGDQKFLGDVIFALETSFEEGSLGYFAKQDRHLSSQITTTIDQLEKYAQQYAQQYAQLVT